MPCPLKFYKLKSTLSGSRAFWIIFSGCLLTFSLFLILILSETSKRTTSYLPEEKLPQITKKKVLVTNQNKSETEPLLKKAAKTEIVDSLSPITPPNDSKQILDVFDEWVSSFQEINYGNSQRSLHDDPHRLKQFYQMGHKLSRTRAKAFEGLIQKDPKGALDRALSDFVIQSLPTEIQKNLEVWHEGYGDLESVYEGKRNKYSVPKLSTKLKTKGKKFDVYTYGERKNLKRVQGLAFYGISIGSSIAIADSPFRKVISEGSGSDNVLFAGQKITFSSDVEKAFFEENVQGAERRAARSLTTINYPYLAGSNGVTNYFTKRYEVISTPMTWANADLNATSKNGRLVCIGSQAENDYVQKLLTDSNLSLSHAWLGSTKRFLETGSSFNRDQNTTVSINLNTTSANDTWYWLSGDQISKGYTNWINAQPPNSTQLHYAAIEISSGKWNEYDDQLSLPFVIEYDNDVEPLANVLPINGFRKVLVIPARFRDEGFNYDGAGGPKLNNLGNPIFAGLSNDSYEPVSQNALKKAMEEVREFYLRNSDGSFDLNPVISPTVTLDYDKYSYFTSNQRQTAYSLQFDSNISNGGAAGNYYTRENFHDSLDGLGVNALQKAATANREMDFYGPAFKGVADINISTTSGVVDGNFSHPPEVLIIGGNNQTNPDADFVPAKAEAVVNAKGQITDIRILDSGSFYYEDNSSITVLLDGNNSFNSHFNVIVDRICVSWVVVTTYAPDQVWGVAKIGDPGTHVVSPQPSPWYPAKWHPDGRVFDPQYGGLGNPGNQMFASTIAHELGHNFGLSHANLYLSRSERPNSDDGTLQTYANPYSIMGNQASINAGDLTIPAKVMMKKRNGFGFTIWIRKRDRQRNFLPCQI